MPQIGSLPRQVSIISGVVAPSSVLRFYQTGTSTPQNAYSDAALANPITSLTADAAGLFGIWYLNPNAAADYRYTLETSAGAVYYTQDNVPRLTFTQSDIGLLLNQRTAAENAAGVTPTNYAYRPGYLERYGAVGDGVTNDTVNVQKAFTVGGEIKSDSGKTYLILAQLSCAVAKTKVNLNGSTLKFSASFDDAGTTNLKMVDITAADVEFSGIVFDGTVAVAESNRNVFLQYASGAHRGSVHNCRFSTLPDGGSDIQVAIAFLQGADDCEAYANTFNACPGSVFAQGTRPRIFDCTSTAPKDVSYALNSAACIGGSIIDCKVYSSDITVSGHIAVEEGASDWVIARNYVRGVKNGFGIAALNVVYTTVVNGGLMADNIVDGGGFTTTAASALMSVSIYYKGVSIINNKLRGMPAGLSSNSALTVPALHTTIQGNRLDCLTGTSSAAAVVISAGGGPIDIIDNYVDCTTGPSRHWVFGSGSFSSQRAFFRGGSMIGGAEGINTALNSPTSLSLWYENIAQSTATATIALSEVDDIEVYFNSHNAVRWPHSIKQNRVVFGNAAPTAGTWVQGDIVNDLAPDAGTAPGWVCVTGGTPGTWKARASVAA